MAAAISEEFGTEPELFPGSDGIFDVVANGNLIFSKHKVGRFPDHGEIIEMLRS
ncbi:MAG: Rdx family protein [Deltaproteobacteria bacterium]|nr:Rdx family protein [Deltaproteobacteria bacterium]